MDVDADERRCILMRVSYHWRLYQHTGPCYAESGLIQWQGLYYVLFSGRVGTMYSSSSRVCAVYSSSGRVCTVYSSSGRVCKYCVLLQWQGLYCVLIQWQGLQLQLLSCDTLCEFQSACIEYVFLDLVAMVRCDVAGKAKSDFLSLAEVHTFFSQWL